MERSKTLINKLQEQMAANASPAAMIVTAQLLQAELTRLLNAQPKQAGSSKVSVVLPAFNKFPENKMPAAMEPDRKEEARVETSLPAQTSSNGKIQSQELSVETTSHQAIEAASSQASLARESRSQELNSQATSHQASPQQTSPLAAPNQEPSQQAPLPQPQEPPQAEPLHRQDPPRQQPWMMDPVLETPTLAHQDEIKELNQKIGPSPVESLNDRLKAPRTEIASFLNDTPVRDLKKAIGVNDRFLFLSELFRGDVDMYERSIKTINNFRILAEAEYWIERELKIKLGWDDTSESAKQFNQLVRRRFS